MLENEVASPTLSVGDLVLVTTGEEAGQQGTIERRRGKHYWWVRLENDHKTYRKESTLKRLSHGA